MSLNEQLAILPVSPQRACYITEDCAYAVIIPGAAGHDEILQESTQAAALRESGWGLSIDSWSVPCTAYPTGAMRLKAIPPKAETLYIATGCFLVSPPDAITHSGSIYIPYSIGMGATEAGARAEAEVTVTRKPHLRDCFRIRPWGEYVHNLLIGTKANIDRRRASLGGLSLESEDEFWADWHARWNAT